MADIAPTVLEVLGVDQPPEMTGERLIIGEGVLPSLPDGVGFTRPPMEGCEKAGSVLRG